MHSVVDVPTLRYFYNLGIQAYRERENIVPTGSPHNSDNINDLNATFGNLKVDEMQDNRGGGNGNYRGGGYGRGNGYHRGQGRRQNYYNEYSPRGGGRGFHRGGRSNGDWNNGRGDRDAKSPEMKDGPQQQVDMQGGGFYANGNNQVAPQQGAYEPANEAPLYQYYQTPAQFLQPPPPYTAGPYMMPQVAPLQAFNSGNGNYGMPPQEGTPPMEQQFFQVPTMMMMPPPAAQGPPMVSTNPQLHQLVTH